MPEYYVFVCPKCQCQAQLLQSGSKTVGCQNCRARLQTEKLHLAGPFETHEKAVECRSKRQADLVRSSGEFDEKILEFSGSVIGKEIQTKPLKIKKPYQIIRDVLSESGTTIVSDCEYRCLERGVDPETFQKTIQKMIVAGEILQRRNGLLELIP